MSSSTIRNDRPRRSVVVGNRLPKVKIDDPKLLSPHDQLEVFKIGDIVEFWSGQGSGVWKPGIIVEIACSHVPELCDNSHNISSSKFERIDVGNGICVIRVRSKVRHAIPS